MTPIFAAIICVILTMCGLIVGAEGRLAEHIRIAGVADNAALAAADALAGFTPLDPCVAAASVARASGDQVVECVRDVDDAVVTVRATSASASAGSARAGPPTTNG